MSNLSYLDKLNIQLQENIANIERSIDACEQAGIDASYTIGQAIQLFISTHNLYDMAEPDLRNEFHDAMHIAALAHDSTPRGEALAGVFEQTLLREPYNGDINQKLDEARQSSARAAHMIVGTRKFNPVGDENFEKPAPVASLESALALGKERLNYMTQVQKSNDVVPDKDMVDVYHRAVDLDSFFRGLMGGRAIYQLSSEELLNTPLAFFGLEKTGHDDELQFAEMTQDKRAKIIENLDDQNIILHHIEDVRTVAELHALGLELPDQEASHPEP